MSEKISKFKGITDEFKKEVKSLIERFNIAPVVATTPVAPVTPEKKFGEAKLQDGSVIKWEGESPLAVGTVLMVIDPTNPQGFLPIADADYTLEDGSTLTTKDGIVTVYTPVVPVTPPAPAMPEMTAQFAKIETELKEVKESFSAVKSEKEALEAKLTEMASALEANKTNIETISANSKKMFELFVEAMDTPQENPIETPNTVKKSKKEILIESLHKNK